MGVNGNKIVNSFLWRVAERFGAQGVTFIVSIILARLLDPNVYGMIALVTVFTTFFQIFVDSGLGTALVQKKDADDLDFSSVFYFNIISCIIMYTIIFFAAPYIAKLYRLDQLKDVIRVLGLILIISGVKNIQQAYVSRHMLFRKFFFATLGGTIGAAAIGIYLAWAGYGVWALVAQYLFNALVDTIVLWFTVKWRPKKMFSLKRLKGLISFGYKLMGVSIVNTFYNNARSLVIGKLYTTEDLGYYNKALQFPQLIALNIDVSIESVLLPIMSQNQDDYSTVKRLLQQFIKTGTYVMMPVMVGIGVCAKSIIQLLLTEKWLPCVPYLQLFCFTFAFYSIYTANFSAYKAIGKSDLYLKVTFISKIVELAILVSTMWFGVKMIAYGFVVSNFVSQFISARPWYRLFKYGYLQQLKDIMPNIIITCIMGIIVFLLSYINMPTIIILTVQIIVGVSVYLSLSLITKNPSFYYIKALVKKRL